MKKVFLMACVAGLFLAACKSKSKTTAAAPVTVSTDPSDASLAAVKTKYPDATMDVLQKGHSIYYGACTRCHGAKSITRHDEKEWVGILDNMAPKAKLQPEEKDAVWKYIMSVSLSAKK